MRVVQRYSGIADSLVQIPLKHFGLRLCNFLYCIHNCEEHLPFNTKKPKIVKLWLPCFLNQHLLCLLISPISSLGRTLCTLITNQEDKVEDPMNKKKHKIQSNNFNIYIIYYFIHNQRMIETCLLFSKWLSFFLNVFLVCLFYVLLEILYIIYILNTRRTWEKIPSPRWDLNPRPSVI